MNRHEEEEKLRKLTEKIRRFEGAVRRIVDEVPRRRRKFENATRGIIAKIIDEVVSEAPRRVVASRPPRCSVRDCPFREHDRCKLRKRVIEG